MGSRLAASLLALLVPALAPGEPSRPHRRARVAVLEIRPLGSEPIKAELLSEVALTEASGSGALDVIGTSDIVALVGLERQRRVLGCEEDAACLVEMGGALGVDDMLVGTLGRLGALYRIDLKLVDTRRARVLARFGESVEGSEEKLVAAMQRGVREVLLPLAGAPGPMLPAPLGTAAARPEGSSRRTWGWTAAGGGAALAVAGVVLGLQAQRANRDEKAAAASGDLAAYDAARSRARSRALAADACYGAGAVALGAGAWLLLADGARVALVPAPGGAAAVLAGRF